MSSLSDDKKAFHCIALSKKLKVSILYRKQIRKQVENVTGSKNNQRLLHRLFARRMLGYIAFLGAGDSILDIAESRT